MGHRRAISGTARANLLRRKQICYGENKFVTAKTNSLQPKENNIYRNQLVTAKQNSLWRIKICHGKIKNQITGQRFGQRLYQYSPTTSC